MSIAGDACGDLIKSNIDAVSDKTNRTSLMRAMGNAIVDSVEGGGASGSIPYSAMDTDVYLTANSDTKIATQKATKTYADAINTATVHKSGDETISGNKTFTSFPILPSGVPTGFQAVSRNYADGNFVLLSTDQTINGEKSFTTIPLLPSSNPTTDNQSARKAYVDSQVATAIPTSYLDTDINLTANSDTRLATQKATKAYVDAHGGGGSGLITLPVGAIIQYGSGLIPSGFVACDGSSLLRTGTYADLFNVIGTNFGSADSNHFNLPDMSDLFDINLYYIIKYTVSNESVSAEHIARTDNPHNVTIDQITDSAVVQATYKTGWIANSDWTNAEFSITHNLNSNLSDLVVKFFISTDGTDANSFEVFPTDFIKLSVSADTHSGITIYQTGVNSFKIQTGADGIRFVTDDGTTNRVDTEAYYYKVAVYKLGTAVISTPTLGIFDSGWVANSDWTANNFTINHNLDSPLIDIVIKFLISTDGTDANSFEFPIASYDMISGANEVLGITISQIDTNSIRVQTGTNGLFIVNKTTGAGFQIDTEAYYYKVKVYKLGNISVIPSTAFEVLNVSANYTITGSADDSRIKEIWTTTSSGNITINLPYRSIRYGSDITIRKVDSGAGKVIVNPAGTETINGYNAPVEITEQNGWWKFCPGNATSTEWKGETDGWSTIYEVSSTTEDAGLNTTSATWDDVEGMVLTPPVGNYLLDAYGNHYGSDTGLPSYIYLQFGLGTTSGNNAPNILGTYRDYVGITGIANSISAIAHDRHVSNIEYTSTGVAIYMKASLYEDETPASVHRMRGTTGCPMFIRARRIH